MILDADDRLRLLPALSLFGELGPIEFARRVYAWEETVKRVDVSRFRAGRHLRFEFDAGGLDFRLRLTGRVEARDTGADMPVRLSIDVSRIDPDGAGGYDQILKVMRGMLQSFASHEADECFLFDGVRIYDPHKDEAG